MKKRICLTEGQLRKVIREAVLNELSPQTYMNAANKRHQNAMDYQRGETDATGSEKRRLEKWGQQPYGSPMKARKNVTYGGGHTPKSANSEENLKSAYELRQHAQNKYKEQNQTDSAPETMYKWESIIHRVTENVIRKLTESIVNSDNEDWCGIKGVHFIWHGEWADPELEYNGLVVNYHELEDYYWADYKDEYPKPEEMSDDEYDENFYKYLNSIGADIISYIEENGEPEVDEEKEKEMNDKLINGLRQKYSWWDDTIPID